MPHDVLKLDNQICFRFYTVSRLVAQEYEPYLKEFGLTYPQYLVMLVLWEKDSQPVNDIARLLYLETNTVTPLLKRMEQSGLVERKRGKQDRRQTIVSLTPKGKSLESKALNIPENIVLGMTSREMQASSIKKQLPAMDQLIDTLLELKQANKQASKGQPADD